MGLLDRPRTSPSGLRRARRVESNGLSLDGTPITLKDLTSEESDAIAGLLGVRRPSSGSPLRVSLTALDRTLRSSAVELGLLESSATIGGPIVDRRGGEACRAKPNGQSNGLRSGCTQLSSTIPVWPAGSTMS